MVHRSVPEYKVLLLFFLNFFFSSIAHLSFEVYFQLYLFSLSVFIVFMSEEWFVQIFRERWNNGKWHTQNHKIQFASSTLLFQKLTLQETISQPIHHSQTNTNTNTNTNHEAFVVGAETWPLWNCIEQLDVSFMLLMICLATSIWILLEFAPFSPCPLKEMASSASFWRPFCVFSSPPLFPLPKPQMIMKSSPWWSRGWTQGKVVFESQSPFQRNQL